MAKRPRRMRGGSIREPFNPQSDHRLREYLGIAPGFTESVNIDDSLRPLPPMSSFGNNLCNDCVIAARANHTLRLAYHPGQTITTQECVEQYKAEVRLENDGLYRDNGLKLSKSLERWRDQGWTAASHHARKIGDFFPADFRSKDEMRATIVRRIGVQIAIDLPEGFREVDQFGPSHPWTDVDAGTSFNHAILLIGYDPDGVIGITWGKYQKISWEFVRIHCTAAFAVVPIEATFLKRESGTALEFEFTKPNKVE